jgi:hypothetical protein
VWSGDIHSDCADFRLQITAGIHMGVAGIPWFTTDIGGFGGGDIEDPGFRELLVRWFQFGAFCPVMRMHGDRQPSERVLAADGSAPNNSGAPNELWGFGEDVYEILVRYVKLREAMRPYTGALEGWGCRSAPPFQCDSSGTASAVRLRLARPMSYRARSLWRAPARWSAMSRWQAGPWSNSVLDDHASRSKLGHPLK